MSRNRWSRWVKRVLAGLLAFGPSAGCKQQIFMEPGDYHDAIMNSLPRQLETKPNDTILPDRVDKIGKVATVLDPDRPARMMTLQECIAIALEQGATGSPNSSAFNLNLNGAGGFFKTDALPSFSGGQFLSSTDAIRVFSFDPATVATDLERSLSKFDVRWLTTMQWQKIDQPTAVQFVSFQNSQDAALFTSTLAKPLPTGGVAGITFSTSYAKFNNTSGTTTFVNPNYQPQVQFTFEQPLLRLFGVEINQLSPVHPGSQVLNVQTNNPQGVQGILINRIRVDQAKAAFDRNVNVLLLNVEAAYWNLYAAYYNLYANEEGMRQSYEGYRFTQIRVNVGTDPPQNLDQAEAQFERFRGQVLEARGLVLDAERQLRGLLNLRSDDGTRIVPIDSPNLAPYLPDFNEAANEAMANLPELLIARQDLKTQQLNLILQKNLRRPDLRVFGTYNIAGLGTRLDGSEFANPAQTIPGNAFTSLSNNQFNSWTVGFRLDVPIGFRDASALVRDAQLNLARSYYGLRDSELKALELLVNQYRRLVEAHAVIAPRQAERKSLQLYVAKVRAVIDIGRWQPQDFLNYLTVQQQLATAIAAEFRAVAEYNTALAAFEYSKGTIQRYNNVAVNEGPLPPWVQKKAADHIRERTESALKLRERDVAPPPGGPGVIGAGEVGPAIGTPLLNNLLPLDQAYGQKREPVPDTLPPKPPDDKKDAGMGDGKMGLRPVPGTVAGLPAIPRTLPMANPTPPAGGPGAGDYFQPSGTVTLSPRGSAGLTGSGGAIAPPPSVPGSPVSSPTSPGRLPAPPALDPLPVPPSTAIPLPVPPQLPSTRDPVDTGPGVPAIPLPSGGNQ
jgi:outer membrane protein TolC